MAVQGPQPYVAVLSHESKSATTVLFFSALADRMPGALYVLSPRDSNSWSVVAGATAVIYVRALFRYGISGSIARLLRRPRYYFLDDNFMLLREEGAGGTFLAPYTEQNMRHALNGFAGVLVSSPVLADDFKRRRLHDGPAIYPPIAGAGTGSAPASDGALRVAFFGGAHLHSALRDWIVPALRGVARTRPVALLALGVTDTIEPSPGLVVTQEPYRDSYVSGRERLREFGAEVLVHPSASGMSNNAFKNPHALITADAVGAVPVVSHTAPYDAIGRDVVIHCGDSVDAWQAGLMAAADPAPAAALRTRLRAYCQERFSGAANVQIIRAILDRHAA